MPRPSHDFLTQLKVGCQHCGMSDVRIVVAVSGGADSVALLRGLCLLQAELRLDLTVAHLDHRLRGDASRADADWVADLCQQLHVPLVREAIEILADPDIGTLGTEGVARRVRRDFLARTASTCSAAAIATAHTADDQAETILHHILRGTGLAGLRGLDESVIPPRDSATQAGDVSGEGQPRDLPAVIVHPMLRIERVAVEAFLNGLGQGFRTDATNADVTLTRNRIRHQLLPLLQREFNPRIHLALTNLADQAREAYRTLQSEAESLLDASVLELQPALCRLHCEPLERAPRHLAREAFARLWRRQNWPRRQMGFAEWDRLVAVTRGELKATTLPGRVTVIRRGGLLELTRE